MAIDCSMEIVRMHLGSKVPLSLRHGVYIVRHSYFLMMLKQLSPESKSFIEVIEGNKVPVLALVFWCVVVDAEICVLTSSEFTMSFSPVPRHHSPI